MSLFGVSKIEMAIKEALSSIPPDIYDGIDDKEPDLSGRLYDLADTTECDGIPFQELARALSSIDDATLSKYAGRPTLHSMNYPTAVIV